MQIDLDPPSKTCWDRWTAAAPFEHSWAYGAAAAAFGAHVVRARILSEGTVRGAAQIICRGAAGFRIGCAVRVIHWLGAPLAGAEAALARALPGLGPVVLAGGSGIALSGPRTFARLALDRDLVPAMQQKWRNRLHFAERQVIFVLTERGCPGWLVRAEAAQRRRKRYAALPARWMAALSREVPGSVETWGAYRDGQPIAGITLIRHGGGLTYHLGWSDAAGRAASAHHLLLARAFEAAKAAGATFADLGVIDPVALPGLTRFKLGAGASAMASPPLRLHMPIGRPGRLPSASRRPIEG